MPDWVEKTLGSVFKVKHGFAFKGEYFTDLPHRYALVTPGNFAIGGGFQRQKRKYYSGPVSSEYVLDPGSVVVTMTDLSKQSDTLGYAALIPDDGTTWLHNQRVGLLQFHEPDQADPVFFSYLMRTHAYRAWVVGSATGTTVKHTAPSRIESFRCLVPTVEEQRQIASVLKALDDKIEVNNRINQTLEAIAQAIFKSWFVDFDPVKAKISARQEGRDPLRAAMSVISGKPDELDALPREQYDQLANTAALFPDEMEESALGEIPKGWEVRSMPESIEVNPTRQLKKGTVAPYLDMANVPTNSSRVQTVVRREFGSGSKFINGDTLLARITPCLENGKTAFVDFLSNDQVGWGSTEFIVLRPKESLPVEFAYFLCRYPDFRAFAIAQMAGTSGRQRVPNDCFANYLLTVPSSEVATAFGAVAKSVMNQIRSQDEVSKTLAILRDTLLPQLLSGELSVTPAAEHSPVVRGG